MSAVTRRFFCPICGAAVSVTGDSDARPETWRLPPHVPAIPVNLCQLYFVDVTLQPDKCSSCAAPHLRHPSGLCMRCYEKQANSK